MQEQYLKARKPINAGKADTSQTAAATALSTLD